jgi:ATP-dependent Clp protease ATP-binding subunit ClpA
MALVEGLAQRIISTDVPEPLRGVRLIALEASLLIVAGTTDGERLQIERIVEEAGRPEILLFIDAVPALAGSGEGTSLLRAALLRGQLTCIIAATEVEYRRFVGDDVTLERLFQPIRIRELSPAQTLVVLQSMRDRLVRTRGVHVSDGVLKWLVDFAQESLRNRRFPEKAIDLLEQCVAHAVARGEHEVDQAAAERVVRRLVGAPDSVEERERRLRSLLGARALLAGVETEALLQHLRATLRGLELDPARPNAVALLIASTAERAGPLAETVAEALYGSNDQVVEVDLSSFGDAESLTRLIGSPPGATGDASRLPLDQVSEMPWCVVLLRNAHACHPAVRDVVAQAIESGVLTEATGEKIYLSESVVLLTGQVGAGGGQTRTIGFNPPEEHRQSNPWHAAADVLGVQLVRACDLVFWLPAGAGASLEAWIRDVFLAGMAERFRRQGLDPRWDESLVRWLAGVLNGAADARLAEQIAEHSFVPLLLEHLRGATGSESQPDTYSVSFHSGAAHVTPA